MGDPFPLRPSPKRRPQPQVRPATTALESDETAIASRNAQPPARRRVASCGAGRTPVGPLSRRYAATPSGELSSQNHAQRVARHGGGWVDQQEEREQAEAHGDARDPGRHPPPEHLGGAGDPRVVPDDQVRLEAGELVLDVPDHPGRRHPLLRSLLGDRGPVADHAVPPGHLDGLGAERVRTETGRGRDRAHVTGSDGAAKVVPGGLPGPRGHRRGQHRRPAGDQDPAPRELEPGTDPGLTARLVVRPESHPRSVGRPGLC